MWIHPLSQLYRMFLQVIQVRVYFANWYGCIEEKEIFAVKLEQAVQGSQLSGIILMALF